jgi:plastocyanin
MESAATFAVLLGLAAACSADEPTIVNLMIENFKFVPDPMTISVGDSITLNNGDPVPIKVARVGNVVIERCCQRHEVPGGLG